MDRQAVKPDIAMAIAMTYVDRCLLAVHENSLPPPLTLHITLHDFNRLRRDILKHTPHLHDVLRFSENGDIMLFHMIVKITSSARGGWHIEAMDDEPAEHDTRRRGLQIDADGVVRGIV